MEMLIPIALALVVVLCAAQAVCISRLADRIEQLKRERASVHKELASWKLAAAHWEQEAHARA